MKSYIQIILLLSFSSLLMACPQESEVEPSSPIKNSYQATAEDLDSLLTDIETLIADKSCQSSSDCALVALGARACGGPNSYEVYAPNNVNEQKLTEMAKQLESLEKQYNLENQVMSICMVEPKPTISCVQNQCKKQAGFSELKQQL